MAIDLYTQWLDIPPGPRPPDYYTLLGLPRFCADPARIEKAAHDRLDQLDQYALSPQRAQREACQRLMNEVAQARVTLIDPQKRAAYDFDLALATHLPSKILPESASRPASPSRPPGRQGSSLPQPQTKGPISRIASRVLRSRLGLYAGVSLVFFLIGAGTAWFIALAVLRPVSRPALAPAAPASTSYAQPAPRLVRSPATLPATQPAVTSVRAPTSQPATELTIALVPATRPVLPPPPTTTKPTPNPVPDLHAFARARTQFQELLAKVNPRLLADIYPDLWAGVKTAQRHAEIPGQDPQVAAQAFHRAAETLHDIEVAASSVLVVAPVADDMPDGYSSATVSPDGWWAVLAGATQRPCLWDFAQGHSRNLESEAAFRFRAAAFAPDGRHLALLGARGRVVIQDVADGKGRVLRGVWDDAFPPVDTRRPQIISKRLKVENDFTARLGIQFSPDGRWILSADASGVELWDSHDRVVGWPGFQGHSQIPYRAWFSADSQTVGVLGPNDELRWWRIDGLKETGRPIVHHSEWTPALSADHRLIVADAREVAGAIQVYEFGSGRPVGRACGGVDKPWMVLVTPDGARVLALQKQQISIFDTTTGRVVGRLAVPGESFWRMVLSPDGRWLLTWDFGGRGRPRLWHVPTATCVAGPFGPKGSLGSGAFTADGRFLILGYLGGVQRWELGSAYYARQATVASQPSLPMLAKASAREAATTTTKGSLPAAICGHYAPSAGELVGAALTPDGRSLLLLDSTGKIQMRTMPNLAQASVEVESRNCPTHATFYDSGRFVVTYSDSAGASVFNASARPSQLPSKLYHYGDTDFRFLAAASDGSPHWWATRDDHTACLMAFAAPVHQVPLGRAQQ